MKRIWIHFLVWAEILIFSIGLSEIGLLCDILGRVFSRPWHKSYSKSVKLKVGHVYGALETCAWLGIHINLELFLFLFFEYSVQKKIDWRKSGGGVAIAPSAPCCRRACACVFIRIFQNIFRSWAILFFSKSEGRILDELRVSFKANKTHFLEGENPTFSVVSFFISF